MRCPNCNLNFSCSNDKNCWCAEYPNILDINQNEGCLCPSCLKKLITQKIESLLATRDGNTLEIIKKLGTPQKLIEGIDYYKNKESLFVFTEWYHLRKGYCCGNGCLHCPY